MLPPRGLGANSAPRSLPQPHSRGLPPSHAAAAGGFPPGIDPSAIFHQHPAMSRSGYGGVLPAAANGGMPMMGGGGMSRQQQQHLAAAAMFYGGGGGGGPGGHAAGIHQQLRDKEKQKRREQVRATKIKEETRLPDNLFQAPVKLTEPGTPGTPGINAEKVLGAHTTFSMIHKSDQVIGVDYQPPTPAPAQHNDDDDEDNRPVRKIPAIVKPPQNNTRLPPNMDNPRPANKPRPTPPSKDSLNMAPPSSAPRRPPPPAAAGSRSFPASSLAPFGKMSRPGAPNLAHLDLGATKKEIEDQDVDRMMNEMIGGLPSAPLTGIITPRVENSEDRGVQQHKPRYQQNFFFNSTASAATSADRPIKSRFSESDSDKEPEASAAAGDERTTVALDGNAAANSTAVMSAAAAAKTDDSSSSDSEQSSDSDSENKDSEEEKKVEPSMSALEEPEESDEEPTKKDFSLATIMKKEEKTPPTSQRTMDPSPRQFLPTPSPQQFHPTPSPFPNLTSPGFITMPDLVAPIQSPPPTTAANMAGRLPSPIGQIGSPPTMGVGRIPSPIGMIPSPPLQQRLDPLAAAAAAQEKEEELNKHIEYVKDIPDVIPPLGPDSESDEDIQEKRKSASESERKPVGRKPTKRKRAEAAKLSSSKDDSDDSDAPVNDTHHQKRRSAKKPGRASSASPLKVAAATRSSPRKPSSVHSTPGRRPQNNHSAASFRPMLSESDEDEEEDSPPRPTAAKPAPPSKPANKSAALFALFGNSARNKAKQGQGGKGKGKGKSGGITVDIRERGEEEEDWDRREQHRTEQTSSPEPPSQTSRPLSSSRVKTEAAATPPPRVPEIPELPPAKAGAAVVDDLALSDEDDPPPLANSQPPLSTLVKEAQRRVPLPPIPLKPNGRPSLLCSLPLHRVRHILRGRPPSGSSRAGMEKKSKDRWITKSDSERIKQQQASRTSESPLPPVDQPQAAAASARTSIDERPASARSNSSRHSSGARSSSHRKAHHGDRTGGSGGGGGEDERALPPDDDPALIHSEHNDRKRRDRDSSPNYKAANSKRLRVTAADDHEGGGYGPGSASAAVDGAAAYPSGHSGYANTVLPPHPSFIPVNNGLMPPPRNHYGYLGRGMEELEEEENVQEEAKRLKHEADQEENMEVKCYKYLQAFMMFSISALKTEKEGNVQDAFNFYNQTLRLIKCAMKPILSRKQALPPKEMTDISLRVLVMSLRAQSLLNLKLYKLKKHELKELQKTISDVLTKSDKEDDNSQAEQPHISPTPSPAGSEESNCSKSSGYTSSGEGRNQVHTPPTTPTVCLSLPKNTLRNQFNIASYLSQCHELWEQADLYASRGSCEGFFERLDSEYGQLNLLSQLSHLIIYNRRGLDYISQELARDRSPLNPRSS